MKTITDNKVPDEIARAAFGRWMDNRHDVYDALLHVSTSHLSARVRAMAGEAADMVLTTPLLRGAYEIDFRARAAAERHATA